MRSLLSKKKHSLPSSIRLAKAIGATYPQRRGGPGCSSARSGRQRSAPQAMTCSTSFRAAFRPNTNSQTNEPLGGVRRPMGRERPKESKDD
jgi:hypothetical protein